VSDVQKVVPVSFKKWIVISVVIFWFKTVISYVAFHCVIFSNCANYVCKIVKAAPSKECKEKENFKG
jgi:hypothetical protein